MRLKSCLCKSESDSQKENLRSKAGHAAHQEDLLVISYDTWQPGGAKGRQGDEGLGLVIVVVRTFGRSIRQGLICLRTTGLNIDLVFSLDRLKKNKKLTNIVRNLHLTFLQKYVSAE